MKRSSEDIPLPDTCKLCNTNLVRRFRLKELPRGLVGQILPTHDYSGNKIQPKYKRIEPGTLLCPQCN